jgi:hypothetical protein
MKDFKVCMVSILLAVIFCSIGSFMLAWHLAKLECEVKHDKKTGYGMETYRGYE